MRDAWLEDAACRDRPTIWFFPPKGSRLAASADALACCATCPVTAACLDDAIRVPTLGIRGGLSEKQRRTERANRRSAA